MRPFWIVAGVAGAFVVAIIGGVFGNLLTNVVERQETVRVARKWGLALWVCFLMTAGSALAAFVNADAPWVLIGESPRGAMALFVAAVGSCFVVWPLLGGWLHSLEEKHRPVTAEVSPPASAPRLIYWYELGGAPRRLHLHVKNEGPIGGEFWASLQVVEGSFASGPSFRDQSVKWTHSDKESILIPPGGEYRALIGELDAPYGRPFSQWRLIGLRETCYLAHESIVERSKPDAVLRVRIFSVPTASNGSVDEELGLGSGGLVPVPQASVL